MGNCFSICRLIKCNTCCDICGIVCASIPAYLCTAHHGWCNCGEPSQTKYEIVDTQPPKETKMSREIELIF